MTVTLGWADCFLLGSLLFALCAFCYGQGCRVESQFWIRQNKAQIEVLNSITKLLKGRATARLNAPKKEFRQ